MPSFKNHKMNDTRYLSHDQTQAHLQGKGFSFYPSAANRKRAVLCASYANLRGSLTLEAAVTLPVFLIALISVLYLARILLVQLTLIGPLHETARRLAQDAYVYDVLTEDAEWKASIMGDLLTTTLTAAAAKSSFVQLVGEEWIEASGIENGVSGLSFYYSSLPDEEDMIDLVVSYQMRIPFGLVTLPAISVTQRCRVHAWVGYAPDADGVQQVYVTEHGTVYHLYLTCSHLNLSIRQVTYLEVANLRNKSGGKYYPCETCGSFHGSVVYITDDGNRYHSTVSCSGLKRGIRQIPIDEVGDMPLCSRCAAE